MQRANSVFGGMSGFTLLELMVVLTIISFLLTIVAPRFSAVFPGIEFKRESAQFAATLRLARSQAIAQGSKTTVVLNADDGTYMIDGSDTGGQFPEGYEFYQDGRSVGNSRDPTRQIVFFPNGTASEMSFLIQKENSSLHVHVKWLTGAVSIDHTA